MTLTERKRRLLGILSRGPRRSIEFTGGEMAAASIAPHVVVRYLTELCEIGLATLNEEDERYYITAEGLAVWNEKPALVGGTQFCNASTKSPYIPPKWNTRADGQPRHASRGW